MLKGIIFDMDGVLVNSEPMHYRAVAKVMAEYKKEMGYEYYQRFIGSTLSHLTKSVIRDYQLPISVQDFMVKIEANKKYYINRDGHEEVEGVKDLLQDLHTHGVKMVVASSSPRSYIEEVTTALGMKHYFDKLISGEEVLSPKPAPDIFNKALAELGLDRDECLIIEDSTNGVLAGVNAGIPVVGYENKDSGNQNLSKAIMIIQGFEEIDYSYLKMIYQRAHKLPLTISETRRLIIRESVVEDIQSLYELYQEPGMTRYMRGLTGDLAEERENLKGYIAEVYPLLGYGLWTVIDKESGKCIGRAGLSPQMIGDELVIELGYMISVAKQRCGYGEEAGRAILQYAKEVLWLEKICLFTRSENLASIKLAEKLAFQLIGNVELEGQMLLKYQILL